jgi:uncharacterized membrane protein YjfL (UPF0719 family)
MLSTHRGQLRYDTYPCGLSGLFAFSGLARYVRRMELTLLRSSLLSFVVHLAMGIVTAVVGAVLIKGIDRFILKRLDIEEEIARGNLAAAVLAGAIWLALAMIFTHS